MDKIKQWELYERGKRYNSTCRQDKDMYDMCKTHYDFYYGYQWRNETSEDLPKPVFNILKRVSEFKIASLCAAKTVVAVKEMKEADGIIEKIFEKIKFDDLKREALYDGCITGDACLHLIYNADKDIIEAELIDGVNVLFGNPNINQPEKQPYIVLVGRDTVENLKQEAKSNKDLIVKDSETEYQVNEYEELEDIEGDDNGKALYIIVYKKVKGKIEVSKYTKDAVIYENVNTNYTRYPIAWLNWGKYKNSYHGIGEIEGLIPNQILINKIMAMAALHTIQTAFPTGIFDAEVLKEWTNEIGAQIPISGLKGSPVSSVAGYINPAPMGNYVMSLVELCMAYTKDMMGITDAALGNIDPKNTSAIIAVQKSAIVPLENVKANLYSWVEEAVRSILDILNAKEIFTIDPEVDLTIDIGDGSYYNEISQMQTLDNLLANGHITISQYLTRVPSKLIVDKEGLLNEIKGQLEGQMQEYEGMAQFIEQLPPEIQAELQKLSPEQMEIKVKEMMSLQTQ